MPEIDKRASAERALRHGGEGRVLASLSSKKFYEEEFHTLVATLDAHQMELVAASPNYGTGKSEFGSNIKAPFENANLADVQSNGYDAVFILDGDNREPTHKNNKNHEQIKRIVHGLLSIRSPVAGCMMGRIRCVGPA